jgi:hypothetical protein
MHILSAAMTSPHHEALRKIRLQKQLACFQIWTSGVGGTEESQLSQWRNLKKKYCNGNSPKVENLE